MKKTIVCVLSGIMSVSAAFAAAPACPQIGGLYEHCSVVPSDTPGVKTFAIRQTKDSSTGAAEFSVALKGVDSKFDFNYDVIADGVPRSSVETKVVTTASCNSVGLQVVMAASNSNGSIETTDTYSLNQNGALEYSVDMAYGAGSTNLFKVTCTK